ncbi:hypothetical protein [Mangrovihabitans endophyticus]|uniref:Uncharacterized protein n=1 Tax=Mangrovihabitans endophyticus TaxID=1751298 RepID=A0A8J3FN30_9ACTN|nr:hypothetical protein [Mangrovihabitans endophyticus]GGK80772.1 hypothetical protein GCM10012284_13430 [Mangrovihabitans endophyticus]
MTEKSPDRIWSGIDITKTVGGALAAVCAAFAGSYLGVAGTVIGAALFSIVGSVGTEIYSRSLRKGTRKLRTIAPVFVRAPAAVGTPAVAAAQAVDSPSHTVAGTPEDATATRTASADQADAIPAGGSRPDADEPETAPIETARPDASQPDTTVAPLLHRLRWRRVAVLAGAVFVLAMGSLTIAELVTGTTVASTTGHGPSGGTTLGVVFRGGQETPAPRPTRPAEHTAPTGSATPATATPTGSAEQDASTSPDGAAAPSEGTGSTGDTSPTASATGEPDTPSTGDAPDADGSGATSPQADPVAPEGEAAHDGDQAQPTGDQ